MNKVEDLTRQVCQQVIVKTQGTKGMQPRVNTIHKPRAADEHNSLESYVYIHFYTYISTSMGVYSGSELSI